MSAEEGCIGWGNFGGQQPVAERVFLRGYQYLAFACRQSLPVKTTFRLWTWCDGKRSRLSSAAAVEGAGPKKIRLKFPRMTRRLTVIPDGFELEIHTRKGNALTLENLRAVKPLYRGGFRKEFDLPAGKIWRAIADVGAQTILYINGQEIPPQTSILRRPTFAGNEMYKTRALDIAKYLRPGQRNCLALYGERVGYPPFVFIQGRVVMTSGEAVSIESDSSWRFSRVCPKGWTRPGFDAAAWTPAKAGPPLYYYMMMNSVTEPAIPAYSGRLLLTNPKDRLLFYNDKTPAVFRVAAPIGLADAAAALRWAILRPGAEEEKVKEGEAREFVKQGDSLVFTVDAGVLDWGVYAIELALRGPDGRVLERRTPEPFVVVRRLTQKVVDGRSYKEGMDLTLEDTIDFTNPNDPHPCNGTDDPGGFERGLTKTVKPIKTPRIVRRGGLTYRETAPRRGAFFTYQFKVKHPGDFYLMELDYPDDAERWMGVSCSTTFPKVWTNSKCAPSLTTGGKYPLTGKMRVHRWIARPDVGIQTIDIICRRDGFPAAAKALRIYHVKELPALRVRDAGARRIGLLTERTRLAQSFGKTFGMFRRDLDWRNVNYSKAGEFRPFDEKIAFLRAALDACEKYAQYMKFTGQNLHVMGCYQYTDNNTPYAAPPRIPGCARVPSDIRDVAVRSFGENGIAVIASIEYAGHEWLQRKYDLTLGEILQGKDTARMISKDGKPAQGMYGWNFIHPDVEAAMLSIVDDLAYKFGDRPNFLGVNFSPYLSGGWIPGYGVMRRGDGPFAYSYDDKTIEFFERDTGVRLPVSRTDPQRFEKRYKLLTSPALREKWIAWRCEEMRRFFRLALQRAQARRKDLQVFASLYLNVPHCVEWTKSGLPLNEFLREWGWDAALMKSTPGVWFTRWMFPLRGNRAGNYVGWEQVVGPEFIKLYARQDYRSVMIHHAWDELAYRMPGAKFSRDWKWIGKPSWPVAGNRGRLHTQAAGDNARETFTQALIGSDPEVVMFGFMDVNMMVGGEQPLREFARVLRCLPRERFSTVLNTGFRTNFAIRALRKQDGYYFYVANPGYWPIRGTVELARAERVWNLAWSQPARYFRAGGNLKLSVSLKPYGVAAFRADNPDARVVRYRTEPVSSSDLAHLRGILRRVESLLSKRASTAILTVEEKRFMKQSVAQAKAALKKGEPAAAWSLVTNYRFWGLWKDYLEKMASLARLPYPREKLAAALGRRMLAARFVARPPVVDGDLSDAVWCAAAPATTFVTRERRPALVDTAVRACYDRSAVYFAVECADPDPARLQTTAKKESEIFRSKDDAVGLFLQPDPAASCYYQLAFNAAGVQFDQKVVGGQRNYAYQPAWKVATKRSQGKWTAEVAAPFAAFGLNGVGKRRWRANFFRRFRGDAVDAGVWSFTGGDCHCPEKFGTLVFLK